MLLPVLHHTHWAPCSSLSRLSNYSLRPEILVKEMDVPRCILVLDTSIFIHFFDKYFGTEGVDGNSSVWSSPWFSRWDEIYDHLIIQEHPFVYPPIVKDLWFPNQKAWNANLMYSFFTPEIANNILQTPIVAAAGQDALIWKLTPAGNFSSKSAYKYCFNNLDLPARQRPKEVHPQIVALLNQVWQDKLMAPRHLLGDFLGERFLQVREQVNSLNT